MIPDEYITQVSDVTFSDGSRGPCYALVSFGAAFALTAKRAIEMQRDEEVPFCQPHPVYPADFTRWYEPDFPQLGN